MQILPTMPNAGPWASRDPSHLRSKAPMCARTALVAVAVGSLGLASCSSSSAPPPPNSVPVHHGDLTLQVNGTIGGDRVDGEVVNADVTCTRLPQSLGALYHVSWTGWLSPTDHFSTGDPEISGEILGPPGSSTFGTNPVNPPSSEIANANVDYAGTRVGGGLSGGSGTLHMATSHSGEIDVTLETGGNASLTGSWECDPA
jgi:hypothetical protein